MLSLVKLFFARLRARWRGRIGGDRPLIDREELEKMLERSRVPAVLMLVLVWTVSAVVLIKSGERQFRQLDWHAGQEAPYSVFAEIDFKYERPAETQIMRTRKRESIPDFYRTEVNGILGSVDEFFRKVDAACPVVKKDDSAKTTAGAPPAAKTAESAPASAPAKSVPAPVSAPAETSPAQAKVASEYGISAHLVPLLAEAYRRKDDYREFRGTLKLMLKRGVVADKDDGTPRRIIGRRSDFVAEDSDKVGYCAESLAKRLLPNGAETHRTELKMLLKKLIGAEGNLRFDPEFTERERRAAEKDVDPVMASKNKGECLIHRGETITSDFISMKNAEWEELKKETPRVGWKKAFEQAGWSFFVLLGGVAFICFFSRNIRRDNLRILLAGLTVSLALGINFWAIKIFQYLLRDVNALDYRMMTAAVPVAFCAVVLSVVLDLRSAICAGGVVVVVSSMMITPYRSLELALRWVVISSAAALLVHTVGNYRSFFVRTLLVVLGMTFAANLDVIFSLSGPKVFRAFFYTILANAALCAMLSLMMVFVLELVFNLSTDMALMVLSDYNHPVLERLKREAPGTMAHCMAVSILAEDAARAIGANPLRAKAGALFHDIGKLANPEYFTENNTSSSLLHDRLTPRESADIIRDHVTHGVEMARKYRLCRFIRGVIATHHGDDLVRFFHNKALEESKRSGVSVDESDFRYRGNPPRSKEEGIISLADACEAASRSLKGPTEESIAALVAKIIQDRFRDGMLRRSNLSAAELETLRKSFISTLTSMMHGRIAYPDSIGGKDRK